MCREQKGMAQNDPCVFVDIIQCQLDNKCVVSTNHTIAKSDNGIERDRKGQTNI